MAEREGMNQPRKVSDLNWLTFDFALSELCVGFCRNRRTSWVF